MPIIEPEFMELTADLDTAAFWAENERCWPLASDKPRCAASFAPDDHWIFEFMRVPSTLRYYQDKAYRDGLHKEVNALTLQHVGKAFFDEDTWRTAPRRIENLFGCEFAYHEGSTPWLVSVTDDPKEFAGVLDWAEATGVRAWAFPDEYLAEWQERKQAGKQLPSLGTGSRGPATIMTSVLDATSLFYWIHDQPALIRRFRDILVRQMIALNGALREFSGHAAPGWWITDDNCALFNRALYREYCYPVLEQVLAAMAPAPAWRYQHSDSAMGHLLEMQYALGMRAVNYGPTVDAALIRAKMPDVLILGQLPPMLLRDGSPAAIQERVIADFAKAGANRLLEVTTAGSVAAGTGLGRMRWMMYLVQEHCRYDR